VEYETRAIALAADPNALSQLKARLAANRRTHPLFDTARFTRDLERAYGVMWERHRQGQAPQGFALDPA
jgi:predicted O-linked N-acetylglucosamine transferase (SPINDLY family)